jgi:hypothetical protein
MAVCPADPRSNSQPETERHRVRVESEGGSEEKEGRKKGEITHHKRKMNLVSTTYLMCTKGQQLQYGSRVANFCLAKRKVILLMMLQRNAPLTRARGE